MENSKNKYQIIDKEEFIEQNTIAFTDIILVFARQLKFILITPVIICSIVIIYIFFISKPIYTSTSKIMSSSNGGGGSQAAGLAAQFGISMPGGQSEPRWVYPSIVKSRILAKKMLKQKFDTKEFGPQKSLLKILTTHSGEFDFNSDPIIINAINSFINMIDISEDKKTSILTLKINASEPRLASEINQVLISQLESHQREYSKTKTSETKKFIEERMVYTQKELNLAEEALKDFTASNRRIENSALLLLERERLAREVTVLIGVFTTLKQQYETTKIEEVKESDYVITIDSPSLPLQPSQPRRVRMVLLAGIIGLGLGGMLGLIREFMLNGSIDDKNKIGEAKTLFISNIKELIFMRIKK